MRWLALALVAALALAASASGKKGQAERLLNGRLAYNVSDDEATDGYADLVVSDPNGKRRKILRQPGQLEGGGVFTEPDWSPDGTKIAATFIAGNRYSGYQSEMFVANANGTALHRPIRDPWANRRSPAWSPDGSKLVFVQGLDEIDVVGADGTGQRMLTTGDGPGWSPDGTRTVFSRRVSGSEMDLFTVNSDGSGVTRLTSGTHEDRVPDWSPDGRLIVFERGTPGYASIYVVAPDGSGLRRLSRSPYDYSPSWSPDGTKIAFSRAGDVWVMARDGRHLRNVTHTRSMQKDEGTPDWQPVHAVDGRISGTPFDDYLVGGNESNVIEGGAGNDVIAGGHGHDVLHGGSGNDTVYAQDRQRDVIDGGPGRDRAFVDKRLDSVRGVERKYSRGG